MGTAVVDLLAIGSRLDSTWQLVHHRAFDEVFACARKYTAHYHTFVLHVYRLVPSTHPVVSRRSHSSFSFQSRWWRVADVVSCGRRGRA